MSEVLISGKHSFKIEVPYRIIETGKKGPKPIVLYLHGFNQNLENFEKDCSRLVEDLQAYHLFIQGPYPLYNRSRTKSVSDWGRAWYLYDGDPGQFIKSLEISSQFLQEIIDQILPHMKVNKMGIVGYSMGGYLAGYFAFTRWKYITDVVVIGCRLKSEIINDNWENLKHMNMLAIHGRNDTFVSRENQKKEIESLKKHGIHAQIKSLKEGHELSESLFEEIFRWFEQKGYKKSD